MRIQIFKNEKGLIYGNDARKIGSDISGTLTIGTTSVKISPETESALPMLFNGCTGEYKATFTSDCGAVYELANVTIRGGRIVPPPPTSVELMELRCRAEALESECEALKEQIRELSNIFDTNSLNFLIN
jgi:hypothetical protein